MKIDIEHVEKSQGLVFKKRLHGVSIKVVFSQEENQIIASRGLSHDIVVKRGIPADVDEEKHQNRGLVSMIATAVVKGRDANHFHLTIGKLMAGTDTYFVNTPLEAKQYEAELREALPKLKAYIMGNAEVEQKSTSFDL